MARSTDHEIRVVPSLLDRLIDLEPRQTRDLPASRADTVRQFREDVQRSLEQLLNARNPFFDLPSEFSEVPRSVIAYGLPDFGSISIESRVDLGRLRAGIEAAIRAFEPRLTGVVASFPATPPTGERALRIRVDARLLIEPAPEAVFFDIVMPLPTRKKTAEWRE
jgi:type VI secretion system protein ImpF